MANQNNNHKTDQRKRTHDKEVINPVMAGAAGAVIGVGVAIAGIAAFRDEKNRAKVKDILTKVKDQASETIHDVRETAMQKKDEVQEKILDSNSAKN